MPEVSRFYGIVIKMFFKPKEHEPPHIHAVYGEFIGIFDISSTEMLDGDMPVKAQELVKEWILLNHSKLHQMWDTQIIEKIEPLR